MATRKYDAMLTMDAAPLLLPGAEPFFHRGDAIGCLLLHGYTASPQEMRELGVHLAAAGRTVYGPRLTHHGARPSDMNRSRWHDWYLAALDGYHVLRAQCEHVIVIGLSMGGATALLLATEQPVAAVVAMSALTHVRSTWRARLARWLWRVHPLQLKEGVEENPQRWIGRYKVRPLRSITELDDYVRFVARQLPRVTAPVLLLHSQADELVPVADTDYIYEHVASQQKQKIILERSDHVITEGVEKDAVFAHVAAFIAALELPGTQM